jgi:hypothetical protein
MMFDLSAVGFPQADDMDGIAAWREYGGVKPVADVTEYAVAAFAVVPAHILDDHRRAPVQFRNQVERKLATFDVGGVFGWIVSDPHFVIVSTIKRSRNAGFPWLITGPTCLPAARRDSEADADHVKKQLGTENRARQLADKTDDLIVVTDSNARVSAGQGSDTLLLTGIDATLTVYRGDGVDRLDAPGANATLRFADQSAADLVVTRAGDDVVVSNAQGDALTIAGWLAGDGLGAGLQTIEFAPSTGSGQAGTVWNGDAIRAALLAGTTGDDHLIGYATADTIAGGAGDDVLEGRDGDDSLDAGSGNDTLTGGADVYLLGSGFGADTVVDGGAGTNLLRFESWQTPYNLRAAREGDDLKLLVRGTADAVTVKDHYAEGGAAQDWRIDFDGANGIALSDFLARPDDAATSIDSLWAGIKADHTLYSIQVGQAAGLDLPGQPRLRRYLAARPLVVGRRHAPDHHHDPVGHHPLWQHDATHPAVHRHAVIDETRITRWGLGGTNPSHVRHHLTTDRLESNDALIVNDPQPHQTESSGTVLATIAWQGELGNYQHTTWSTVSYAPDPDGGPDLETRIYHELESYDRAALITAYTANMNGWTAPAGQVEGNQVAVDYLRRDSHIPMASEIVAGAADNAIHAASGVLEFVDGGAGNDTIHGDGAVMAGGDRNSVAVASGQRLNARGSRRWRDGNCWGGSINDSTWRIAA